MHLSELAEKIEATIVYPGQFTTSEIHGFYAGDKMSDLLNEASATTLIVTNLLNRQLIRFAEIMDVPGICLLNGVNPDATLINVAAGHGTTLVVSPWDMTETCRRLAAYVEGK